MLEKDNHSSHPTISNIISTSMMSIHSTSAFTQSTPQVSSDSLYLDVNIRVAANTCSGVENHVADITAFLIKELSCSAFAERRRLLVQDPLPLFISKIVNATTPFVLDIGAVIAAAHILLMRLHETNRSAGAAWSGHKLFLSAFAIAAQEQPSSHPGVFDINTCVFWSILSKFTVEEVSRMQVRLFEELDGQVWVFAEVMEKVKRSPLKQLQAEWRQEDEEVELAKKKRSFSERLSAFLRRH